MTDPIPAPEAPKGPGPNASRYFGTYSKNNDAHLSYADEERFAIMADFLEILSKGYSVDRAMKLLGHWATSEETHKDFESGGNLLVEYDGPHRTYGRAVPARKTIYVWREQDKEFADAWDIAYNQRGKEALEDHALDMAFAGNDKLVMFLLKARDPQKYANFGAMSGGSFQVTITPADEAL